MHGLANGLEARQYGFVTIKVSLLKLLQEIAEGWVCSCFPHKNRWTGFVKWHRQHGYSLLGRCSMSKHHGLRLHCLRQNSRELVISSKVQLPKIFTRGLWSVITTTLS